VVDLLGDDVDFTPYVQASEDVEFGQFQEATSPTSPYVIFLFLSYLKQ
jgi:hypothetical protein